MLNLIIFARAIIAAVLVFMALFFGASFIGIVFGVLAALHIVGTVRLFFR